MIYRVCQVWGDGMLHNLLTSESPIGVNDFLNAAEKDGRLRFWGEVVILDEIARYTLAQWLRSQRVREVVDGLLCGWRRPEFGHEYVKDRFDEKVDIADYDNPHPNTLASNVFPQDQAPIPLGSNWHIRAKISRYGESLSDDQRLAQKAEAAAQRLALHDGAEDETLTQAILRPAHE